MPNGERSGGRQTPDALCGRFHGQFVFDIPPRGWQGFAASKEGRPDGNWLKTALNLTETYV